VRGKIVKLTLVTEPHGKQAAAPPGALLSQKLTVCASGRAAYTTTAQTRQGSWKRMTLDRQTARTLLARVAAPFRQAACSLPNGGAGLWRLTLTTAGGQRFRFVGACSPNAFAEAETLSYLLRQTFAVPDFFAFDHGLDYSPHDYIYLSCTFTPDGKSYYYRTTDTTIRSGDRVVVPVVGGEHTVTVVKVEHFRESTLPMPLGAVKSILRKQENTLPMPLGAVKSILRKQENTGDMRAAFRLLFRATAVDLDVIDAHRHCRENRQEVQESKLCGCFFCGKTFPPEQIVDWTDSGDAICPYCDMDSVLGDRAGFPLDRPFLARMYEAWFHRTARQSLLTPLGEIQLTLDEKPVAFSCLEHPPALIGCSHLDGAYQIDYVFEPDGTSHILRFALTGSALHGEPELYDGMEALSFSAKGGKLTLGCNFEFEEDGNPDGVYTEEGLLIFLESFEERRVFSFGVIWMA
jgi:hypothetical protein